MKFKTSDSWWYENSSANGEIYGRLYFYEVALNVCPVGWHLPSDDEWTILTDYLGGVSGTGGKLKEAGTKHSKSPNKGATNETGFTALPSGYRTHYSHVYMLLANIVYFWSSTPYDDEIAYKRWLDYSHGNIIRGTGNKKNAYPVRCVKN